MTEFKVSCSATQDCETIEAIDYKKAVEQYLDGYQTIDPDGEFVPAGERYSTLTVWQGEAVVSKLDVFADGRGGVSEGA